MIRPINGVSVVNAGRKPINLAQKARDVATQLGVDVKVAQERLRDAKLSGINLKTMAGIKKAISGDFKNCMSRKLQVETCRYDTVSYIKQNRAGSFQQYNSTRPRRICQQ